MVNLESSQNQAFYLWDLTMEFGFMFVFHQLWTPAGEKSRALLGEVLQLSVRKGFKQDFLDFQNWKNTFCSNEQDVKNLTNYAEEHRQIEALHYFDDVQHVSVVGQKENIRQKLHFPHSWLNGWLMCGLCWPHFKLSGSEAVKSQSHFCASSFCLCIHANSNVSSAWQGQNEWYEEFNCIPPVTEKSTKTGQTICITTLYAKGPLNESRASSNVCNHLVQSITSICRENRQWVT